MNRPALLRLRPASLLACLAMLAAATLTSACSNEDDLPDVTVSLAFKGAAYHDGTFYLTTDDTLEITSFGVTSNDAGLQATVGAVSYYWNYMLLGTVINPPFAMEIPATGMDPGSYVLQLTATIYQTDKSVGIDYVTLPVVVVAAPEQVDPAWSREGSFEPLQTEMRGGVSPTV